MTNWSEFISSLIATFVGFLLALLGNRIYDWYKDTREGKDLVKSFKSEIQNVLSIISTIMTTDDATWLNPVKTPVWDSVINMNKLALISGYSWYSCLLQLYDDIKDYNEWHHMRTQQYFNGTDVETISKSLADSESEIREKIESLIRKMG